MDNPAMPSLLVAHHRPGFYFRVLEEGEVRAGDAIEQVAEGPERLTVADVDALLYLPGKSRDRLERALRVPALSEGWQGSFRELLAAQDAAPPAPAWPGFRSLRVAEVRRESTTVSSFRLVAADGPQPAAAPGQYLTLRLPTEPPLVRSYSLSDLAGEAGYRISVKRDGAGSRYLHDHVRAGDVLDAAAPRGSFVLHDGTRPVVLLSAGVGATPVLAMLHALVLAGTTRPVWWLHGARNRAEHPFREEAERLLAALPGSHRVIAYSRPEPGDECDVVGRLDVGTLEHTGVPADGEYYVCGPAAFMSAIGAALTARGVAPQDVRTETFGAVAVHASGIVSTGARAPHAPDGPAGTGVAVTFVRSALTVPWDERFASLLDFAEACDVPVGFGCRTGVCHNCESGVLSGGVDYTLDPLEPPTAGRALMCCTRPGSELTLDL
jgi:ferredoxin-NADP reductase/ferredoxin